MEKKLSSMFDFQRFARNPRLAKLIAETEARFESSAIDDDDLVFAVAAGDGSSDATLENVMNILNRMGLNADREFVRGLIAKGGSALADWAKKASGGNAMADLLPKF